MPEVTDETIKRKHKEFNKRIQVILGEVKNKPSMGFMDRLRQVVQMRGK